ncbi:FapA family protein [Pseudodesulfovibrio indicus]|uniref:Flagellar Assembly Protein A N-terminal region domain-containing protein n=1 Tax=Pseudodesulfovibrio indicus TaxID=1716143 RepID=A0A126QKK1_9BACT|nr:FapA family protein [Pseudodesulfovibrio indicus]AMK10481.1 hypothetical protein AWY79_04790 [Pseudodesulfovibrio indicus]TDT89121.1 hypothetical protein EDC59_104114 [Pseudodesulfovibrio indicus]
MPDDKGQNNSKDARFRFCLSEDGMKLGVNRYFPPSGGEGPSVELLRRQVAEAGVRLPIDEEAARRIVEAVELGNEFRGITLVRGVPPTEPRDASLAALGDLEYPVFPNDQFLRFRPAAKAANGVTIDGRPLTPERKFVPKELEAEPGENVEWDPAAKAFRSRVWGTARITDGVVAVDPAARITEDEVEVIGTIRHKDFKGEPITPARIDKELRDMGVLIDPDLDKLEAKLNQAAELDMPLPNQVLVKGQHPIPGRDGWLEYLVSTREEAGTEDDTGRLDFRNRGIYPMAAPGQIIARLHRPTSGEGGIDIYGKTIPASAGHELHVHLGENVLLMPDGVSYESRTNGVVVMERGTLSVTDCLLVNGNVDLNSGNVKVEHGSVKIRGSVQSGFSVSAPKHVIVEGSIESATIHAGGQVEVKGGILMPDGGEVVSEGDVVASYAANARIRAGGDVHITNEIQNSVIQAEGKLYALSGKGTIQGGEILTRKGVEVNEIGSELGVATVVGVHIESAQDEELRQERAKVVQAIQKIDGALGTESPQALLARTPPSKRPAVAEVLKHRQTLVRRRKTLSERINQLALQHQEELEGVTIKVNRLVHPGVVIRFGTVRRTVDKRLEASVFYWDARRREIGCK